MKRNLLGGLIALGLFFNSLVYAATVSASFTAVGNGGQLFVRYLDNITYSVSGTFSGTVVLERTRDNGLSWEYVLSSSTSASGTIRVETPAREPAVYRFRCSAFVSGTIVTSIADASADVPENKEFKNVLGQAVGGINETGLYCTDLSVSGTTTLTSAVLSTASVVDANFSILDDGDATKIAKFQVSGITAGNTRTYTLPNATGTLADLDTAQTFTNKTLTSPTVNGATVSGTWTGTMDLSGSSSGVKVNTAKATPAAGDNMNVYSGTYTPTYTRSGATFSGTKTSYWSRVGNMVFVTGYTDVSAGGGMNPILISLPITPTAFSATNAERAECSGASFNDSSVGYGIVGTSSGTTCSIENVPNAATGMRWHLMYRVQ